MQNTSASVGSPRTTSILTTPTIATTTAPPTPPPSLRSTPPTPLAALATFPSLRPSPSPSSRPLASSLSPSSTIRAASTPPTALRFGSSPPRTVPTPLSRKVSSSSPTTTPPLVPLTILSSLAAILPKLESSFAPPPSNFLTFAPAPTTVPLARARVALSSLFSPSPMALLIPTFPSSSSTPPAISSPSTMSKFPLTQLVAPTMSSRVSKLASSSATPSSPSPTSPSKLAAAPAPAV